MFSALSSYLWKKVADNDTPPSRRRAYSTDLFDAPLPKRSRIAAPPIQKLFSRMGELFVKGGDNGVSFLASTPREHPDMQPGVSTSLHSSDFLSDFQFQSSSTASSRRSSTSSTKSDLEKRRRRRNGMSFSRQGLVKSFLSAKDPECSPPLIDLTEDEETTTDEMVYTTSSTTWTSSVKDSGNERFVERFSPVNPRKSSVLIGSNLRIAPINGAQQQDGDTRRQNVDDEFEDFSDEEVSFIRQSSLVKPDKKKVTEVSWKSERSLGPSFYRTIGPKTKLFAGKSGRVCRNNGRIGKKTRKSALQDCVDLEEKQRYIDLLHNLSGSELVKSSVFNFSGSYSLKRRPIHDERRPVNVTADDWCNSDEERTDDDRFGKCVRDVRNVLDELISPPPYYSLERSKAGVTVSTEKKPTKAKDSDETKVSGKREWDKAVVLELNKKFELDPDVHVGRIRRQFTPAAQLRRDEAKKYEKELELRRLARIQKQKSLDDVIRTRMRLEGIVLLEPEEEEEFSELTNEQEEAVDAALGGGSPQELLVQEFTIPIHRRDIQTLGGLHWLNDEIINFYMNLLMKRGGQDGLPKVYAFNTFFYPKLMQGGHSALKRWTRKVDIFSFHKIFVPVHLGVHWCLAVIDFKDKAIRYFDSMGGSNSQCLKALGEYVKAESLDKKKQVFDMTGWKFEHAKDIPEQLNGSDCGVFTCKFAEYLSRNANITFAQEHMPYFRRRMVFEIMQKQLL